MCRKPLLRFVVVLLLGLALAGPVHAVGTSEPAGLVVSEVFASAWDWLRGLWAGTDHGCGIDPDGKPWCTPVTTQGDHGCDIDPDGRPRCTQ